MTQPVEIKRWKSAHTITFQAIANEPISQEQAELMQAREGKRPAGYGFYGFKCERDSTGLWVASWWCGSSCD